MSPPIVVLEGGEEDVSAARAVTLAELTCGRGLPKKSYRTLFLVYTSSKKSSPLGTFQFQDWNFSVPREELLGGRALGRGLPVSEWK